MKLMRLYVGFKGIMISLIIIIINNKQHKSSIKGASLLQGEKYFDFSPLYLPHMRATRHYCHS